MVQKSSSHFRNPGLRTMPRIMFHTDQQTPGHPTQFIRRVDLAPVLYIILDLSCFWYNN